MEQLFRKYSWSVNAAFVVLLAFMVARLVSLVIEAFIAPGPQLAAPTPVRAQVLTPVQTAQLTIENVARITGLTVPREPEVVEPTVPAIDPNAPPVKTSLRVRLLGTLVAGSKEWSFASIQDGVTQKTQTFMVGDVIQGAEITDIERDKVLILNGGRREFIDATAGDGMPSYTAAPAVYPPPTAANTASPTPSVLGQGIRAVSDTEYEVPRAEIDRTLSNLNDVAMQARIVPAFKDGVAHGFKLFSIRPDSIYSKIGIQNGDVIRRINGYDLNSPEKALEIYSKLKEASRIEIEVDRNGSVLRKTYNVR